MLEQVKRWFEPPVFPEDEDKTRKARILSVLLVSILGLMVPAVLAMLFVSVQKMGIGLILFCLLALVFVSAILMRKGRVQTASGIFVAGLWLLFTLMYVLGGRTTSSAASLLVAVIVISGLLLGERLTTILAVLSCLIGLGLAALESTGFPLIHYFPGLPIPSWVTWTFAIFLTLKPLNLAIDSITRSAETLRESEERLKFVLEGSQLGYWDWNMETGAVQRNSYWAEMLGYTLEEIQTTVTQWTDLHHPDDRALAWKSLQDHLDGKAPRHKVEYRMRTRDGQYKWILDQAKVVARGSHGQPIRMSGTHTDITDRKHIEEAEHKQRALAEAMSDSAAILNSTLNFEDVLDRIMDNVGRVLPHDAVGIILLDETGETANITRYHDNRSEPVDRMGAQFSILQTRNLHEMQISGRPVIINDTHEYEGWIPAPASEWIRSTLGVPIKIKDEIIGFLSLARSQANSFTRQDIEHLQAFVNYAGIAIENARLYEEVQRLALTDPLTSIFNRTFFEAELMRLEGGRDFPVSIIIADLDNMKIINDTLGHSIGDALLKNAALILREVFRADEIIARIGGDEFAVLLPRTDQEVLKDILPRVHRKLDEHNAVHSDLPVHLSIGASTARLGKLMDAFIAADQNMYEEKTRHKAAR